MRKSINKSASMTAADLILAQLLALVKEKNTPMTSYVVAEHQDSSYSFKVFSNGTIQATVAGSPVAFHLSDCTDYTYPDRNRSRVPGNATPNHITSEQFMDMKWTIRVALEAEDRLNKKRRN